MRLIFIFLGFVFPHELPLHAPILVLQRPNLRNPPIQLELALHPKHLDLHPLFLQLPILTPLLIFYPLQFRHGLQQAIFGLPQIPLHPFHLPQLALITPSHIPQSPFTFFQVILLITKLCLETINFPTSLNQVSLDSLIGV